MDMSGGDAIDGPRWTGGFVEMPAEAFVVAPSEGLASACILSTYGERDGGAEIVEVEELGTCDGIIDIIEADGTRPRIIRPFVATPVET